MLDRCYNVRAQEKRPTYIGCTVSEEWLLFSNFLEWLEGEYAEWFEREIGEKPTTAELHSASYLGELALDKDILVVGNKVYSSELCCLCSREVNKLLNDHANAKGNYTQGVSWHKVTQKFVSQINIKGKVTHLGLFDTEQAASIAYRKAKKEQILKIAKNQPDKIKAGLLKHAELFS